ncbi:MAG: glycosyltransferase family 2 protein [Selenomonadaceae bacterium]|nr:glycosyltransferase family 2 protein [Selenomonadaceae bacterium]
MNVVIPMAGDSKIFKDAGFKYNKNFTEINHKPLFQRVFDSVKNIGAQNFIFVVNNDDAQKFHINKSLKLIAPNCKVVVAQGQTAGAACSVLLAAEFIDNDDELIIFNGDQVLECDLEGMLKIFRANDWDGGILTFESVHPRWSFVRLDENNFVIETAEKDPISNHATAGFYYFKHGKDFVDSAKMMIRKDANVNGCYYVCPAYNEMIIRQKVIGCVEIDGAFYFPLTTPKEVDEYEAHVRKNERRGGES